MSYLLDTNVLSELTRTKPNPNVLTWFTQIPSEALYLSVLTLGEIRKGLEKIQEQKRREKIRLWLEHELPDWFEARILPIDRFVAERWGNLQHEMNRPLPAIDSLLAATALHYHLHLVTHNTVDFQYPELQVIDPWALGSLVMSTN